MITLLAAVPLLATAGANLNSDSRHAHRRSGNPIVTISVDSGPNQTFAGFGASIASETSTGWTTPSTPHQMDLMAQQIWKSTHATSARLWMDPQSYQPTYGDKQFEKYFTAFVTTNRVPAAIRNGAKDLLLAPFTVPTYMNDGSGYIAESWIPKYAALLADFIKQFRDHTSWLINWTGVCNEPTSGTRVRFKINQWPTMIKALRQKLDSRGLQAVHILAPETSQPDPSSNDAGGILSAIYADKEAWADLDAVATHSYGICANPDFQKFIHGKPWWNTESGSLIEQDEKPNDAVQAATMATRFLTDMNYGITNWQFFIGTEIQTNVNSSNLMYYDGRPNNYTALLKLYYLQELAKVFDNGAVFRHCSSSLDGKMTWDAGKKSHVTTSVARNPNGSFGIGISNFTSNVFVSPSSWLAANGNDNHSNQLWMTSQAGYGATTYDVTIKVPELQNIPSITFNVYKTNSTGGGVAMGAVVMTKGTLTVQNLGPLDLITLRSKS